MRLLQYVNGNAFENKSFIDALGLGSKLSPVISVVGAGGKTSLILTLADEYVHHGKNVIITTTTHMLMPGQGIFSLTDLKRFSESLKSSTGHGKAPGVSPIWLGSHAGQGERSETDDEEKMSAPTEEIWQTALALKLPILIEADGSKRHPCKAPAEHEPVIRPETTGVIGVLGMDSIGRQIGTVCHRPELVADLLHTDQRHRLTWMDLIEIAVSRKGLHKAVTDNMDYQILFMFGSGRKEEMNQNRYREQMMQELHERGFWKIHFAEREDRENV